VAIAWIGALVADLVINKPMGWSPKYIEFKRAHLYDINPVGVGAMLIASLASFCAHFGLLGTLAQAAPPLVSLTIALIVAPFLAWLTQGRYYIARTSATHLLHPEGPQENLRCGLCNNLFETPDMAYCPAYRSPICSLCCSLDARCGDQCKTRARLSMQLEDLIGRLLPRLPRRYLHTRLAQYLGLMTILVAGSSGGLALIYNQVAHGLIDQSPQAHQMLTLAFLKAFLMVCVSAGVLAWWIVLTRESRRVAQEESERQTSLLIQEIEAHERTDQALQKAKEASEAANAAKSRYITGLSHELRTPLNSILGFTQILQRDALTPAQHQDPLATILRSSSHLLSLIDGLLDVAKIEAGKLRLEPSEILFQEFVHDLEKMFASTAGHKNLTFRLELEGRMPMVVRGDEKRVRQILINLLGNAVNFTDRGEVILRVSYRRETAIFDIIDTGIGIASEQIDRIFQPFERGGQTRQDNGVGLGLTITRMLTSLMGGALSVSSNPGEGTRFQVRLFLSEVRVPKAVEDANHDVIGYHGKRRRVLVVDDHAEHRKVISGMLEPLGFEIAQAENGMDAVRQVSLLHPDLILMDLSMPDMDGWTTIRMIRHNAHSDVPVIVLSANANISTDENLGHDYLSKPLHLRDLLDRLKHHLKLEWQHRLLNSAETKSPWVLPPRQDLEDLHELCGLGHVRGIQNKLDAIERESVASASFIADLRALAKGFRLDELSLQLKEVLNERHHPAR
jgi:signal transduction histidine kinase/CheY-like chemotaxis protein